MPLSCHCDDDYDFWHYAPEDFSPMPGTPHKRRCCSCKKQIMPNTPVLIMEEWRSPQSDHEENRFGDEVPLAPKYLCEQCGEIYFNLKSAGFCMCLGHDLREDLKEYWDMTGFNPEKYNTELK